MFESIDFTVFEEQTEDIIYQSDESSEKNSNNASETQEIQENRGIVVDSLILPRFDWEREGTSLVL